MPCVSIIVPIYNTKEILFKKCIFQLINQTLDSIEIILVDDGAPLKISKLCDSYRSKDSRIKVIHQKNSGVSVARNNGLRIARGKYILFVDSDDYIEIDMCQKYYVIAEKYKADLVIGRVNVCYEKHQVPNHYFAEDIEVFDNSNKFELQKCIIYDNGQRFSRMGEICSKLILRNTILENNLSFAVDIKISEDSIFNFELIEKSNKIICINDISYNYIIHNENTVSQFKPYIIKNNDIVFLKFQELFIKYNKKNDFYELLDKQIINKFIGYVKNYFISNKNKNTIKEKINQINTIADNIYFLQAIKNKKYSDLNLEKKFFLYAYINRKGMLIIFYDYLFFKPINLLRLIYNKLRKIYNKLRKIYNKFN